MAVNPYREKKVWIQHINDLNIEYICDGVSYKKFQTIFYFCVCLATVERICSKHIYCTVSEQTACF